ncbi:BZ3500_MvSof-1268-A1-R1_Chr3-2g06314 [Microbotryum saponariae]|uniref:BZ3500_MvSof-1268-A1-R1_Chr3-2g06314 protein n=1 Tax=Microbotryum saponariae TaxID=289078 RepID=A0A2X0LHE6_9BASI|nr:BZ3500_MvSof-1268-A1-R1_Chr3-2g06314 [Microbotryum saponariae]SDA04285.1 BZ3501_MvSof-1269-A2-R1_Chr3-2g06005 [Microbotryum saponariae]
MNGPARLHPAPQTGESGPISPMPRGVRGPRFLMQFKVKILISPSASSGNERAKIQHPHQYEGAEMMASPRPSMSSARVQSTRPEQVVGARTDQSGDRRPGVRGNEVHHPLPFPGRRDSFDPNRPASPSPSPAPASRRRFSLTTLVRTSTTTKPATIPKPSPPKTPPSPLSSVKQNLKKGWTHLNLLPRGPPNQETQLGVSPRQRLSTSSSRFVEDLRNRKISSPFVSGPRVGGLRGVENGGWRSSFDGATVVGMNELGQLERPSATPNPRNARHSFQSALRPTSSSTYPPRHSLDGNVGPTLQPNPPSSTHRTTSLSPPPHCRTPTPTPSNPNSLGIKRKPAPAVTPSLIRQTTSGGGGSPRAQSFHQPTTTVGDVLQRRSISGPGPDGVLRRPVLQEVQALTLRSSMDAKAETETERGRTAEEGAEV